MNPTGKGGYKEGESGNPKGRPKGSGAPPVALRAFRAEVQAYTKEALEELVAQLRAVGAGVTVTAQRYKAATKLIELAYGTPTPWQDEDGLPVDIRAKPPEERERLLRERGEMLLAAADREKSKIPAQVGQESTEH